MQSIIPFNIAMILQALSGHHFERDSDQIRLNKMSYISDQISSCHLSLNCRPSATLQQKALCTPSAARQQSGTPNATHWRTFNLECKLQQPPSLAQSSRKSPCCLAPCKLRHYNE
eukprot:scaffold314444_cov13-Prasinocladus_malaysianus.AAC.1